MSFAAVDLTTIYILARDIVVAGFLLEAFKCAGASATFRLMASVVLAGWLGFLYLGISGHWLFPANISGFTFFVVAFMGLMTVSAVMLFFPPVKTYLLATPQELLLLLQGPRMFFGAGWLIESTLGVMPPYFGIADGITHITAGFLAMKAAILCARGENNRGGIWIANIFGLLDIVVVALGIAFVMLHKDISPYHNVMYAVFFAAPIFIGLHFISMLKLIQENK